MTYCGDIEGNISLTFVPTYISRSRGTCKISIVAYSFDENINAFNEIKIVTGIYGSACGTRMLVI